MIRHRSILFGSLALLLALALLWLGSRAYSRIDPSGNAPGSDQPANSAVTPQGPAASAPIAVYAHNIMLRKGPQFRIYITWISGRMLRTQHSVDPSFDNPESFVFRIDKGVIHANLGDIGNFLSSTAIHFPLKNVIVRGQGDQLKLTGTMHKLHMPLPVELVSTLSATPDGRIHLHVEKISVLKLPVKALLSGLHVEIDDFMGSSPMPGVQVVANDIFFNTTTLLPPPHIKGLLTSISITSPDLILIYGNAPNDQSQLAQWHNFLRFKGGTLGFGNLTMHPADLTLIDASNDPWFDLDLVNYKAQLGNSYSRMTAESGFEIFMPDFDALHQKKKFNQSVTLDWLKNRAAPLPSDVHVQNK
ncbi:MAG: hypothetical protein M3Y50_09810 [Acidobacteriota bacterium]|nr:hypothetical protein [Acidobacteriota bacterium]